MSSAVEIALSLFGGMLVGLMYFGGLWWTVVRLKTNRNPAALYLSSLVVRVALLLSSLLLSLQFGIVPVMIAFAGFYLARITIVRKTASYVQ